MVRHNYWCFSVVEGDPLAFAANSQSLYLCALISTWLVSSQIAYLPEAKTFFNRILIIIKYLAREVCHLERTNIVPCLLFNYDAGSFTSQVYLNVHACLLVFF